jgi:hypothetical protein
MRLRRQLDPRVAALLDAAGARGPGPGAERLLAWGELADGQVMACTELALHIPEVGRVPWEQVVRGSWSEEFLDLVLAPGAGGRARQVRLRFEEPGQVPGVVRERVNWTVVASHHAPLRHADGRTGGAMLNARRSPADGEVRWGVVFDAGLDPADPGWRAAADAALADLRDQLGI